MKKSSIIEITIQPVVKFFENDSSRIYRQRELEKALSENRKKWHLAESITISNFIDVLLQKTKLKRIRLDFPNRVETRYVWGDVTSYELALSLSPDSYLSHYTAIYLHGLTEQIPKILYLNRELQPTRQQIAELTQESIDMAFGRPARVSHNIAKYGDEKICILNSKHTGGLGMITTTGPSGGPIRVTNIERTLIDIMVRPVYSGGVYDVLKAYRLAHGKVSVKELIEMLKEMDFVYPYHQVMGFYLEKAELYQSSSIEPLRKMEMKHDFYLTHGMKSTSYSKEWRLFFPKGF